MRNSRLVSCNRDWTGLTVIDKNGKPIYLDYYQIEQIRFGYYTETKFFVKKTSEKIEIQAKGFKSPIILTKRMDWENFEQYKQEITKFAKDNKISLVAYD